MLHRKQMGDVLFMNKKALLAILIAAMLLLSGCTLKTIDTVADAAQVILSITDKTTGKTETVTKGLLSNLVAYNQNQNQQMNDLYTQAYGYPVSYYPTDASTILGQLIESFTRQNVLKLKGNELGFDQLTEEEAAEVAASAQQDYDNLILSVEQNNITSGATGDALRTEAEEYIKKNGLSTLDDYIAQYTDEKTVAKLEASVKDPVQVTEEDLTTRLNELVENAKTTYQNDVVAYCTAVNNGTQTYYSPAGWRYVKHILISFSEEDQSAVAAAQASVDEAQTAHDTAEAAVTSAQEALNAADENGKAAAQEALDAANATLAEAEEALTDAAQTYNNTLAAAQANIQSRVDEVVALVNAPGADFDALMAQYGEDPGMQAEPAKTNGYAICEGYAFVEPFLTEALKLENVGDISAPVTTSYGVHIIKYVADGAESEMTLDEARVSLQDTLLTELQNTAYDTAIANWTSEMDIKTWTDKMGY